MTAGRVDLDIYQGEDWALQIYWTDAENHPFQVQGPIRMDVQNDVGGAIVSLTTNEDNQADDDSAILYNSESGLIQLQMPSAKTDLLAGGGVYRYDLFVHYVDPGTGIVRKRALMCGSVNVTQRITANV